MVRIKALVTVAILGVLAALAPSPALGAFDYYFSRITYNNTEDLAGQLRVNVADAGTVWQGNDLVSFTFYNDVDHCGYRFVD